VCGLEGELPELVRLTPRRTHDYVTISSPGQPASSVRRTRTATRATGQRSPPARTSSACLCDGEMPAAAPLDLVPGAPPLSRGRSVHPSPASANGPHAASAPAVRPPGASTAVGNGAPAAAPRAGSPCIEARAARPLESTTGSAGAATPAANAPHDQLQVPRRPIAQKIVARSPAGHIRSRSISKEQRRCARRILVDLGYITGGTDLNSPSRPEGLRWFDVTPTSDPKTIAARPRAEAPRQQVARDRFDDDQQDSPWSWPNTKLPRPRRSSSV